MNQDILSLYKKAQNGGLNAQEVFWLEGQAAAHPSFSMLHMILARHHFRNQSTIKNRALLKAAAYAGSRTLLRHYLEDTLIPPRQKPVPVAELKPILEKKDAAKAIVDLEKKPVAEAPAAEKAAETPVVETPAVEAPAAETPVVEASAVETPAAETPVVEAPAVEAPAVETPVVEAPALETPVVEAPAVETPVAETPVVETPVVEAPAAETPVAETPVVEAPAAEAPAVEAPAAEQVPVAYVGKPGDVNWFLNMRIKLRRDKHQHRSQQILASIAKHAAAPVAAPTAVAEPPKAETPAPVAESPKADSPKTEQPVTKPETKTKDQPTPPDKNYEIGSFSNFTFVEGGAPDSAEEEIELGIMTLDAVEYKEHVGSGEIIFEENDRIVEIIVSPEALNKYFKGRLPGDSVPTFGEFQIELDESEYHGDGQGVPVSLAEDTVTDRELTQPVAETPVVEPPKQKVMAIIDRFIENEPGITRAKVEGVPQGDLAKESNRLQDDGLVTETLAKIYLKQGNKAKAIKIYEKLRLRNPEKSDYFASLIENLKH